MSESVTPWTAAHQASLSFTIFRSLYKLMSIESVVPFNCLILCHPLLCLPSTFPSIRVFSNESALHIRWQQFWSFTFSISAFNEYLGLISFKIDCILSPCLFNLYSEYNVKNARLDEAQAGIKISRRNINNLRYADDITIMAESEAEVDVFLEFSCFFYDSSC